MSLNPTFAVFGCGAIGSAIGGYAARAGEDVLLIEPWEEHAAAMQRDGLLITAPNEEWRQSVDVITPAELEKLEKPFDIIVLSVKSMDTVAATELLKPYLSENGCIVSAQNSINEDQIAPIVGPERTVGCVVLIAGELTAPAHVQRKSLSLEKDGTSLLLGELNGEITDRLRRMQQLFAGFGPIAVTENLLGARWGKLTRNSMNNTLAAVTHMGVKEILCNPVTRRVSNAIGFEIIRVADAMNIPIDHLGDMTAEDLRAGAAGDEEILDKKMAERGERMTGRGYPSTAQDAFRGRPVETEYFNGYISRRAAEVGVAVPMNEYMVNLGRRIDAKLLSPDQGNVVLFEAEALAAAGVA